MISASIVDGDCPIGQTCMFSISQLNDSHIAECGYFNNSVCYPGEINISVEETCSAGSCILNAGTGDQSGGNIVFNPGAKTGTGSAGKAIINGDMNVTGDGFFSNLGSLISRITKGWFVNLDISEDLNVTGNFTGNQIYGGMWYHNHTSTSLVFATANQYYHNFMTDANHINGFTPNNLGFNLNSSLTVQVDGVYRIDYMAVGSGQNNHVYMTSVFVNETNKDNCESHHKMSSGGDEVTQKGNCLLRLNAGENVSLRTADTATGTGEYFGSNLNINRVGN